MIAAGIPASDIGVICLYREQKFLLGRSMCQNKKSELCNVKVSTGTHTLVHALPFTVVYIALNMLHCTVDAFQGSEKEIIFLSTARTSARRLGFLASPQRLNVSITRARRHIILVGMARVLKASPLWRAVIGSCTMITPQTFLSRTES